MKTPFQLVNDKLIRSIYWLHTSNLPRQIYHPKCSTLENDTFVFDLIFQNYFQGSMLEDFICENCSSGSSESIKLTFTVPGYSKEPPSVLKILFQRGTYDMTTGEAIKNELKVAIPLEFLYKKPSINEKISYTLVLLINHDGDSLDCVNYTSDVFNANIGIWWHFDGENITQISDLPKGVILERVTKTRIDVRLNICNICCLYHNKSYEKIQPYFFKNTPKCPK